MYVKEFMQTNVITTSSDTLLAEAQKIMAEHKIRRLPVVDGDKLVGLLTYDRISKTMKHPGIQIANPLQFLSLVAELKVKDVMETNVITVTPDTTPEAAMTLGQKHHVGTLPVVEGERLVGILTSTDIYRFTIDALGFDRQGVQLHIFDCKEGTPGEIPLIIGSKGVSILSLLHLKSPTTGGQHCLIHLDTTDASEIEKELTAKGYKLEVRPPSSKG